MFRSILQLFTVIVVMTTSAFSQGLPLIEPPHWWTNMPSYQLMIMLHQEKIGEWTPSVQEKSLRIKEVIPCPNPNYLFLTLNWDATFKPSTITIQLEKNGQIMEIPYTFKPRDRTFKPGGLQSSDAIYRITTDRFANGDSDNDRALRGKVNRKDPLARHGGDLKGILDNADYIRGLGMTAVQLDPVQKNEGSDRSFDGNQISSHFELDLRLGDSTTYRRLIQKLHRHDMKIVQELNFMTVSTNHILVKDSPFTSWFHKNNEASKSPEDDVQKWDVRDPILMNYLTQLSWWWIEKYHLDALRISSCTEVDPTVLEHLTDHMTSAYPGLTIFSEREAGDSPVSLPIHLENKSDCGLPIQSNDAIQQVVNQLYTTAGDQFTGVNNLYQWMAENEKQKDPNGSILFVDNAHLPRYHDRKDKKLEKWKMGLAVLATSRGIPSINAGTEVLIKPNKRDALIQADFPGGWKRDRKNKFTKEGRKKNEEEAYYYMQRLINWRVKNQAIIQGTLVAYPPQDAAYAYFRRYGEQLVMVVINTDKKSQSVDLEPWMNTIRGYTMAKDIFSGKEYPLEGIWELDGLESRVLELER